MNGIHLVHVRRLQPGGAIVLVMTRWNMKDLTSVNLLNAQKTLKADQVGRGIEFPAILPSNKPDLARVLEEGRTRRC